jgi:hypothetical protein
MGITDTLRGAMLNWLMPEYGERMRLIKTYGQRRDYREGVQRRPLKVKPDQADDNLTLNFTGLIVDRNISMLFGDKIDFDFGTDATQPEGAEVEDAREVYLDKVIKANVYPIFLHKIAQFGATYGTVYVKIIPNGLPDNMPRLVAVNPNWIMMDSAPEDLENVIRYTIEYNYLDENDKEVVRREVTEHNQTAEGWADSWSIKTYIMREGSGGKFELVDDVLWSYPFPPICHWQNLPDAEQVYGDADITEDMIAMQDAINFVGSNVQRIIRYHAHPKTWGRGFSTAGKASWGADEMVTVNGQDAVIQNLEMQSDLASSREFLHYLRGILFDISRTVDLSSMQDSLGALTNFALRVLYKDAIDKLNSKRLLYGWGLTEINRRLFALAGIASEDGGEIIWPDALPLNDYEQAQTIQIDMGLGIVDKETASTLRGYDWSVVEERLANESQANTNLGDMILRSFEQGGGASQTNNQPPQMQQGQQMQQLMGVQNAEAQAEVGQR